MWTSRVAYLTREGFGVRALYCGAVLVIVIGSDVRYPVTVITGGITNL